MRRVVTLIVLLMLLSLMFGCIMSFSPQESSIYMHPGESRIFRITTLPESSSLSWFLNGVLIPGETGNSCEYTAAIGDSGIYQLKVVERNSFINSESSHTWDIHIVIGNLVSVTISPVNSSIPLDSDLQFTAIGTYDDNSTLDITNIVNWASSNPSVATISNSDGTEGLLTSIYSGSTVVSAETNGISDSTELIVTDSTVIFPEDEWLQADPEDFNLSQDAINNMGILMAQNQANGVLIYNGYLVAEWNYAGPSDTRLDVQSCTKSITSLMLGLAIDDGVISNLDDVVADYYPGWYNKSYFQDNIYVDQITFRHLITCTSGIAASGRWDYFDPNNMEPGLEFHYHNDHTAVTTTTLTYLYGTELRNILYDRVLNDIGASMRWGDDGTVQTIYGTTVSVNAGYAFSRWTARDLARIGYLYLNRGKWKGRQLLSEDYVDETFTEIPFQIDETDQSGYGLGWWTGKGTNVWSMLGNGGQFCMVLPEYNIVMTKINDYHIPREDQLSAEVFYPLIMDCIGVTIE